MTSARANNFIAGGPTGMSIMANQSAGSFDSTLVCLTRAQMIGMLILQVVSLKMLYRLCIPRKVTYVGKTINLMTRTKIRVPRGMLPASLSLLRFRMLRLRLSPTTITCRVTKSSPTFLMGVVSQAWK